MSASENPLNVTPLREADPKQRGFRAPPHNFEAEMALLGALLSNNRAYDRVSEFLRAEHFADARHGRIYAAVARLIEHGQIADPVTLKNFFEQDGALDDIGGAQYLARLAASVVTIINTEDYGRTIYDRFLRRELINLGEDVVNEAYKVELDKNALSQIEIAEEHLYKLATEGKVEGGFKSFDLALREALHVAEAAYKREGHIAGVATGLTDLDKLLGGLHPSDLVILAGRPSMGKTALATNIAFTAARAEARPRAGDKNPDKRNIVAFFSLEMSAEELATRLLAQEARVSGHKIRRGEISQKDFSAFAHATQLLSRVPLFIDDTPALSVSVLRTRARRLKRQQGSLALIVVDYLQLLRPSHDSRPENRVQEISDITRMLKALAKELGVPVLALSQLSRQVEQREDKRPQLSDLRESGSIEQDADVVMFVYREEYYLERLQPEPATAKHAEWQEKMDKVHNVAEVIVGKQRHGPVGLARLHFDAAHTRFDNLADPDRLPDGHG
jgi:replicative DNA helicase